MSSIETDHPVRRERAAAISRLIERAAKRADCAGRALEGAAQDLLDAGADGAALDDLSALLNCEAERVSHLTEDIESRRPRRKAQPRRRRDDHEAVTALRADLGVPAVAGGDT